MAHVGVEGLAARDAEDDRAEGEEPRDSMIGEEQERVPRIDREQHGGRLHDRPEAEHADRHEPDEHDRAEGHPDPRRTEALDREEREQDDDGDRYDEVCERGPADLESLDGAQDGDGGGDDSLASEERRAEQTDGDEREALSLLVGPALLLQEQREQREDPALAAIVRPQDEGDVLDADDEDQRPDDEREDTDDVVVGRRDSVLRLEALAEGVERAGPDVAVDDAQRGQGEQREAASRCRGMLRLEVQLCRGERVGRHARGERTEGPGERSPPALLKGTLRRALLQ